MDIKSAGLCIKRNREKKSISLFELTEQTGIGIEILQAYESGNQKPKAKELKQISKAIDLPLIMLIRGGGMIGKRCKDADGKFVCKWKEY